MAAIAPAPTFTRESRSGSLSVSNDVFARHRPGRACRLRRPPHPLRARRRTFAHDVAGLCRYSRRREFPFRRPRRVQPPGICRLSSPTPNGCFRATRCFLSRHDSLRATSPFWSRQLRGISAASPQQRVHEARCAWCDFRSLWHTGLPHELSGGHQQRRPRSRRAIRSSRPLGSR